jgi:hypothetical protein
MISGYHILLLINISVLSLATIGDTFYDIMVDAFSVVFLPLIMPIDVLRCQHILSLKLLPFLVTIAGMVSFSFLSILCTCNRNT